VGLVLLSHVADWPEPHDLAREERILPGWGRGQRGQPAPWVAVKGPLVAGISGGGNLWEEAVRPGFTAGPLPGRLVLNLRQDLRRFHSANVLARLRGSDPALAAEHVCLSAHWDGLGRSERAIYRGVIDNAVSVGELLEAAALARLQGPSRRSLLFFFPTAEEAALVGSEYFVEHPTVPLDSIVACLNKDGSPEAWGRSLDVVAVAASAAPPFEAALRGAVEAQGLAWSPNPFPSEGFFFRSDHYSFLRAGVPGTLLFPGLAFEGREPAWGLEQAALYLKEHYHRSSDDLSRVLGWEGAARYVRFWLETARALADGPALPKGSVDLAGRE
jgi:Zn-dependent M28 family amino/carboxypeptidase